MSEDHNARAVALRAEWDALRLERDQLLRITESLRGSNNGDAIRAHGAALAKHHERVEAFEKALATYHAEFGPLGNMPE